jgi:hypothetical protein
MTNSKVLARAVDLVRLALLRIMNRVSRAAAGAGSDEKMVPLSGVRGLRAARRQAVGKPAKMLIRFGRFCL